jgi:hypothetical protein
MSRIDLYCKVCGLPFKIIKIPEDNNNGSSTKWLLDATLRFKNHKGISVTATDNRGSFTIKHSLKKIPSTLLDSLNKKNLFRPDNSLKLKQSSMYHLIHKRCSKRYDKTSVKQLRKKVKVYHNKTFDTKYFLKNKSLRFLLKKPSKRKINSPIKTLQRFKSDIIQTMKKSKKITSNAKKDCPYGSKMNPVTKRCNLLPGFTKKGRKSLSPYKMRANVMYTNPMFNERYL